MDIAISFGGRYSLKATRVRHTVIVTSRNVGPGWILLRKTVHSTLKTSVKRLPISYFLVNLSLLLTCSFY